MQFYKVIVNESTIDGEIPVDMVYTEIYANSAEEAVQSVIVQKGVNREKIVSVQTEAVY